MQRSFTDSHELVLNVKILFLILVLESEDELVRLQKFGSVVVKICLEVCLSEAAPHNQIVPLKVRKGPEAIMIGA